MKFQAILVLVYLLVGFASSQEIYPVAVFHGMGDACANPGMKQFVQNLSDGLGGAYVACIAAGEGIGSLDHKLNHQSKKGCELINDDPQLKGKTISVVGLSQGGLIARDVVEACDFGGEVKRFVSIAGPHMGVATIPKCFKGFLCNMINDAVRASVYIPSTQDLFGPANMFNNVKNQSAYIKGNIFLPQLNNQKTPIDSYKSNFEKLEVLLLTMFENDTMVNPPSSAWFSQWDSKMKNVIPMEEQEIYTDNLIGLKTLNEKKLISFLQLPGDHLQFTLQDINKYFVPALAGLPIPTNQVEENTNRGEFYSDSLEQLDQQQLFVQNILNK